MDSTDKSSGKTVKEDKEKVITHAYQDFSMRDYFANINKQDSSVRNKEAMRLVRVIVTSNNPNKDSYQGEIFSVRNKVIPEVKKFVPFNKPTHVPQIMLNMLKSKRCQKFKDKKLPDGTTVKESYLTNEYNIQELPPLTTEEFNAIKQKQLAEGKM